MKHDDRRTFSLRAFLAVSLSLFAAHSARAQTPPAGACKVNPPQGVKLEPPASPEVTTGIRLTVTGADGKPLQRKRFYLLERPVRLADLPAPPRREDFLAGASPQLREWLARHDCDSLYCPEYEAEYEAATQTVPEFKKAFEEGLRKYRNRQLALRWLTVNFPLKDARTEYYRRKTAWLEQAAQRGGKVMSAMTDEKGWAYFLGLRLRDYYVSNLLPFDEGGVLWECKVTALPPIPKQLYSVMVELSHPKPPAQGATK